VTAPDRFSITVNVEPVPKGRPRVVRQAGRGVRTITPTRTVEFEHVVRLAAQAARPKDWELEGFFRVEIVVRRARRAGDVDNFAKACLDSLNRVAWNDDAQVVSLEIDLDDRVVISGARRIPGVTIAVFRMLPELAAVERIR